MKRTAFAFILAALAPLAFGQADDTGALPTRTPDRSTTCTLGSLNAACTLALEGRQGVGGYLAVGTLSGTVTPEVTVDGTNWVATSFLTWAAGASPTRVATITTTALFQVELPAGTKQARIRVSAYVSGSGTGTLIATETPGVTKVAAAGANTEIQFNDAGSFAGDSELTWNNTLNTLTVNNGSSTSPIALFKNNGVDQVLVGDAGTFSDPYFKLTGTVPVGGIAAHFELPTTGTSGIGPEGFEIDLNAGYTGGNYTGALIVYNTVASTGVTILSNPVNGIFGSAFPSSTIGSTVGVWGQGEKGSLNVGVLGHSVQPTNSSANVGVLGVAANAGTSPTVTAGHFEIRPSNTTTNPTFASGAIVVDNTTTNQPILIARDNGTPVFTIDDGGTTTMTAPLLAANGTTGAPSYSFVLDPDTGIWVVPPNVLAFSTGGTTVTSMSTSGITSANLITADAWVYGSSALRFNVDTNILREAANIVAQRTGTNAQIFRWYGTFTDGSNYTRAAVNTTSTTVTFAAETAGTGADDIDVTLSPAGTGSVTVPTQKSICLQDSAGGDEYCLSSEATAPAGTTQLALNIDAATCTGDGNGGALTVNGSNEIVCSADAGGAGSGLPHPEVMTRASYGGF